MQLKIVAKNKKKEYNVSRFENEIKRLKSKPKDYTYEEIKGLLNKLGFFEYNKGKTSGSRVVFINKDKNKKIEFHRPHPNNLLKMYIINNILNDLEEWGMI